MKEYKLTQEEVAEAVGKSRSYIANITRLLNLDEEVRSLIVENKLTSGHGRTILGLNKENKQIVLAKMVIDKNLSVRDTEALVKKLNKDEEKEPKENLQDPLVRDIEEELTSTLGTKVVIKPGKKKGKIEIEYYNDEELERIIDLINK